MGVVGGVVVMERIPEPPPEEGISDTRFPTRSHIFARTAPHVSVRGMSLRVTFWPPGSVIRKSTCFWLRLVNGRFVNFMLKCLGLARAFDHGPDEEEVRGFIIGSASIDSFLAVDDSSFSLDSFEGA